MEKEFIPYHQAVELKLLGFKDECAAHYLDHDDLELKWKIYRNLSIDTSKCLQAPTYRQAFIFFREKYNFHYSIGTSNICVYHIPVTNYHTTFMIQDCKSHDEAEQKCIDEFIKFAKQL